MVETQASSSWDMRDHQHYVGPDLPITNTDDIPLESLDSTSDQLDDTSIPEGISNPNYDL